MDDWKILSALGWRDSEPSSYPELEALAEEASDALCRSCLNTGLCGRFQCDCVTREPVEVTKE